MDAELKSKLLELTIGEVLSIINQPSKQVAPSWSRYTIGKLDAYLTPVTNSRGYAIEYSLHLPDGILCNIKEIDDVENCIKEINAIIMKYQK